MSGVILGASAMFVALASSASSASAAIIEVHLKDQNFNPKIVSAKAGDTVVFHNDDRVLHSVLLPDNEALLAQHFIEPHASWPIGSISTRRPWPRGAIKSN
jgi:plastocyanin